jgi:hypothetical protein
MPSNSIKDLPFAPYDLDLTKNARFINSRMNDQGYYLHSLYKIYWQVPKPKVKRPKVIVMVSNKKCLPQTQVLKA